MAIAAKPIEQQSGQQGQSGNNHSTKEPPEWKAITMVGLTAVFVVLYVLALFDVIKLPADDKLILRLEPIIAVIIGYFFGRVPGEKAENSLKQQVNQQARNADAARNDKEAAVAQLSVTRATVEHAKAALSAAVPAATQKDLATTLSDGGGQPNSDAALRRAAIAALKVLESDDTA